MSSLTKLRHPMMTKILFTFFYSFLSLLMMKMKLFSPRSHGIASRERKLKCQCSLSQLPLAFSFTATLHRRLTVNFIILGVTQRSENVHRILATSPKRKTYLNVEWEKCDRFLLLTTSTSEKENILFVLKWVSIQLNWIISFCLVSFRFSMLFFPFPLMSRAVCRRERMVCNRSHRLMSKSIHVRTTDTLSHFFLLWTCCDLLNAIRRRRSPRSGNVSMNGVFARWSSVVQVH